MNTMTPVVSVGLSEFFVHHVILYNTEKLKIVILPSVHKKKNPYYILRHWYKNRDSGCKEINKVKESVKEAEWKKVELHIANLRLT